MIRVEHVLDSWRAIRQDTAAAVEDFPAGELDFRPTADVDSFHPIACHIPGAADGDFTSGNLRERVKAFPRHLPAEPTAALAARPARFLAQLIARLDRQRVTRLEMIQAIKEHELTHRAQLFLYLRLKGIVPAATRHRLAKQSSQ
jgi:uncharacterized damage-inducible protein DinB